MPPYGMPGPMPTGPTATPQSSIPPVAAPTAAVPVASNPTNQTTAVDHSLQPPPQPQQQQTQQQQQHKPESTPEGTPQSSSKKKASKIVLIYNNNEISPVSKYIHYKCSIMVFYVFYLLFILHFLSLLFLLGGATFATRKVSVESLGEKEKNAFKKVIKLPNMFQLLASI